MEWLDQIKNLSLPWYATVPIVVLTIICTKGITAYLAYRKSLLEERQYDDGQTKAGYEALIAELKNRVDKLEGLVDKQAMKLDAATAAHAKCEVNCAELRGELNVTRGELNVMKEKVSRLEAHDKANKENVEKLKAVVIEETPKI